ncbi:MAG: WbqC family protein [Flavobacterium sp.]|nr:WbqC family protein [Pedobacter sp.]
MEKEKIFPLFYLPPIEYFQYLIRYNQKVVFEKFEHFPKQTFRNRSSIHSPNGKLNLIVPVIKGSKAHTLMKDVKISYDFKWQRQHLMSLQTSYRSSAYFEYYEDEIIPFYSKRWEFLFDYNDAIMKFLIKALKLNLEYDYTESYTEEINSSVDFRLSIHPKNTAEMKLKTYFQVFEDRNGFIPNLSILDLLFNQGPQSINFLT